MRPGSGRQQAGNLINRGGAVGSNSGGGVPDGILCQVCNKVKSKENYAKRQLLKYNPYNKSFARNPSNIRVTCKTCTPGQTSELHCCICDTNYGLDKFAKNQRKDPDRARCMKCVDRILETEPDMSPPATDDEDDDDEDTDNDDWKAGAKGNPNLLPAAARPKAQALQMASNSKHATPPNARGTATPVTGRLSYAGSVASSTASTGTLISQPRARESAFRSDDMWQTVKRAGPPTVEPGFANWHAAGPSTEQSSRLSTSVSRVKPLDTKSNGWAKVPKTPKGKEQKWGEGNAAEEGEDEWAKYGRDIRDAKAGKSSKKKKQQFSGDDDDDSFVV